jgi:hypothetical protein
MTRNQAVSLARSAGKKNWDCIGNIRSADLFISSDGRSSSLARCKARSVPPVLVAFNRVDLKEEWL